MIQPAETTRDRLLDAAEALFAERGYGAVGIREISDRAGVNLSGIKYHFGSKRGLYLAAVERTVDRRGSKRAWAILDRPVSTRGEAVSALREFVTAFLRVLLEEDQADSCACMIIQSAIEPGDATDLVVREFIAPHQEQLARLVGVLRPDATEAARGRLAQSVMAVLLHQRVFRPFLDRLGQRVGCVGGIPLDQLADELTEFALRGLGCAELTTREPGAAEPARAGEGAAV